jgi:uncharacterized protein YeeX (DUF496 family)
MTSPDTVTLIGRLLEIGGQAGILYVAIWFLVRILKSQYDSRIDALEKRSDECEMDRRSMHEQIHGMQQDRIKLLEDLVKTK